MNTVANAYQHSTVTGVYNPAIWNMTGGVPEPTDPPIDPEPPDPITEPDDTPSDPIPEDDPSTQPTETP